MLIVASAACFGTIVIFTTLARRAETPLLAILAWRYAIAAAVLLALGARSLRALAWRRAWPLLALGIVGQAGIAFLSLRALDFIPAAMVSFLFFTFPAWVALLAAVRGVEPLTRARVLALGASLAGIALLVGGGRSFTLQPIGIALALASAVGYAVYVPVVAHIQRDVDPESASALICTGATVAYGGAAFARGDLGVPLAPRIWAYVIALALLCTVCGFLFFLRGLRLLAPVRASIVATAEPFFTAVLGWLVLAQRVTWVMACGGALIAAAVVVLQRSTVVAAETAAAERTGGVP